MAEDPVLTLSALVERSLGAQLHDNAAFLAERLVSIAPTEVNRHLLALAYVRGGNPQQAVAALKTAASPQNRYLLAKCCIDVENFGDAEDALLKGGLSVATPSQLRNLLYEAPDGVPNGAAGVYLLAVCAQKTDRLDRASDLYKLSLELDPSMFCAYEALCRLGRAPHPQLVYGYPEVGFENSAARSKAKGLGMRHDENAVLGQAGKRMKGPPDSAHAFANALDANKPSPLAPATPAMRYVMSSPAYTTAPVNRGAVVGKDNKGAAPASAAGNGSVSGIAGISGIAGVSATGALEGEEMHMGEEFASYLTTTSSIGSDTGLALFSGGGRQQQQQQQAGTHDSATHTDNNNYNIFTGEDDELMMSMVAPATPAAATAVTATAGGAGLNTMAVGTAANGPASAIPANSSSSSSAAGVDYSTGPSPIAQQLTFVSSAGHGAAASSSSSSAVGPRDKAGSIITPVPMQQPFFLGSATSAVSSVVPSTGGPAGAAGGLAAEHSPASLSFASAISFGAGGPSPAQALLFSAPPQRQAPMSSLQGGGPSTGIGVGDDGGAVMTDNVARRLTSGVLSFSSASGAGAGAAHGAAASVGGHFLGPRSLFPPSTGVASVGPRRGLLLFDTPADETPVAGGAAAPSHKQPHLLSGVRDAPQLRNNSNANAAAAGGGARGGGAAKGGALHPPLHPPARSMGLPAAGAAGAAAAAPLHQVSLQQQQQHAAALAELAAAAASSPTLRVLGAFAAALYGLHETYDLRTVTRAIALLPLEHAGSHEESAYALSLLGRAYAEAGKYPQALACFEQVRGAPPITSSASSSQCVGGGPSYLSDADVHSTVLWHLKQPFKLEALAAECFAADRRNPVSLVVSANSASLKRDHAAALQALARAIGVNPRYVYAHTLAGHEHLALGDLERAKASFRAALRYDPRHYNALYGFGAAFLREDKLALAEQYFKAAVAINRHSPVLHCYLGMALNAQKRHHEALHALDAASSLAPGLPQASYQRALVYLNMGDDARAERELLAVHELAPKEPTVLVQLGKICKARGKTQEALTYLSAALANTRGDKDIGIVKHLINGLGEGEDGEAQDDDAVF